VVFESVSAGEAFVANGGGYLTLSFIPTLGTMIWAGRRPLAACCCSPHSDAAPTQRGRDRLAAGLLLHVSGICPVVKRIWTPSWTLFSGGACFLSLAAFSWVIDVRGYKKWAFPLVVIGMNSIAAYLIAHLLGGFITDSFLIHLARMYSSSWELRSSPCCGVQWFV